MRHRVFFVDDEEVLAQMVEYFFAQERPQLALKAFSDPLAALLQLNEDPPEVLIADLSMPGMHGIELILAARQRSPGLKVIVVTAYGSSEVRQQLQRASVFRVIEKPFATRTLAAEVDLILGSAEQFSGQLTLPEIPDLVQIVSLGKTSGSLSVANGELAGVLWFREGDLEHCECGELEGTDAFREILTWTRGTFALDLEAAPPKRSIHGSIQGLLLDALREIDERRRDVDGGGARDSGSFDPDDTLPGVDAQSLLARAEVGTARMASRYRRMANNAPDFASSILVAFDSSRGEVKLLASRALDEDALLPAIADFKRLLDGGSPARRVHSLEGSLAGIGVAYGTSDGLEAMAFAGPAKSMTPGSEAIQARSLVDAVLAR